MSQYQAGVFVVVAVIGLGLSPAAAQNPPTPAPPAAGTASGTSMTTASGTPVIVGNEKTLLDAISEFYERVRQTMPGDTSRRPLGQVVSEWAREIRTIRVKIGERLETLTYPAGAIRKVDITEARNVTRIYFGPFKAADESGTCGEYDPEFGVIKMKKDLAKWAEPPRTPLPKYGEANVKNLTDLISIAQTLWHEFLHSTQGRQPGTVANETITWHATLATTSEWVRLLRADYDSARTLENARYLLATIDAWGQYYLAIEEQAKKLEPRPMPTAEKDTLTTLREQIGKEHQAIETLEGLLGPPTIPGIPRTLDGMLKEVRATSLNDLERQLVDAARIQVDQGKYRMYDAARKDQEARRQAGVALEVVRPSWEQRVAAAAATAKKMTATSLIISTANDEVEIDPKTGQAELIIQIDNEPDYKRLAEELGRALRRACGSTATATVVEQWLVSKRPPLPALPWTPGQSTKDLQIDAPGDYTIAVTRTMTLGVDLSAHGVPTTITTKSNSISVKVITGSPKDLAGPWTGKVVIQQVPLSARVKAASATPGSGHEEALGGFGAMGAIPPETFAMIVKFLEALKGQPMDMTLDVQPKRFDAGAAVLSVTPSPNSNAKADKPVPLSYSYSQGAITLKGERDGLHISAEGTASPAVAGWSFAGNWNVYYMDKGQKVIVVSGTWSGDNPNAR